MILNIVTANLYRLSLPYPWIGRRDRVVRLLKQGHPDVILFQECPERETWIASQLVGGWVQASDYVNCPILVNSERFKLIDHKAFKLTGTDRFRYGSGAVIEDRVTAERVCVISVHPSSNKETNAALDRPKQIKQLLTLLGEWQVGGMPVDLMPLFIGGDMNDSLPSTHKTGIARVLVTDGMVDARDVLATEKLFIGRAYKTSTGWSTVKKLGPQIDRGYASRHFRFTSAEVIFTGRSADHNFVRWTVELKPVPVIKPEPETPDSIKESVVKTSLIPSGVLAPVKLKCAEVVDAFPLITHVWGGGTEPDHVNKRCIDYMVINTTLPKAEWPSAAAAKALGDAVTAYNWKRRKRLDVNLIIWRRRIIRNYDKPGIPAGTWVAYTGPNPHMDHPHVQYGTSAYLSQYLGPYTVDPAKVTTTLLGFRGTDDPKERPPGFVIDTGVDIVEEKDRKWLITESGWAYDLSYLILVPKAVAT